VEIYRVVTITIPPSSPRDISYFVLRLSIFYQDYAAIPTLGFGFRRIVELFRRHLQKNPIMAPAIEVWARRRLDKLHAKNASFS